MNIALGERSKQKTKSGDCPTSSYGFYEYYYINIFNKEKTNKTTMIYPFYYFDGLSYLYNIFQEKHFFKKSFWQ